VQSAVVRLVLVPRLEKLGVNETDFMGFLKLSFAQKRKTLWNNLKVRYASGDLTGAMKRAKIQPSVRAEALSLEQSAALFRELTTRERASRELTSRELKQPRSPRHA
jgi:16S rRNA (adenine1518-N6/adenine1519-N6)-dimethyltransferase